MQNSAVLWYQSRKNLESRILKKGVSREEIFFLCEKSIHVIINYSAAAFVAYSPLHVFQNIVGTSTLAWASVRRWVSTSCSSASDPESAASFQQEIERRLIINMNNSMMNEVVMVARDHPMTADVRTT